MLEKIISYFKVKILTNSMVKNIFFVGGGTAFAQILTTVSTPIITRIYSTSEYGLLTTFNSVLSILGIAGALKYELSIPIAEDEEHAKDSIFLSVFVLVLTTLIITLILFLDGERVLQMLGTQDLFVYWYMIPLGVFCVQLFAIFIQYAYRNKDFKTISRTTIKQSVVGNVLKLVLGVLGTGPVGLLFSRILSESVGTLSLAKPIFNKSILKEISGRKMLRAAKRYFRFPLFQFPSTIFGQLVMNMPVFFLGSIYNSAVVGAFGIANTVVQLTTDLIGKSVGNVFYAEAAKIGKNEPQKLKILSNSIIKKLAFIGAFPLIVLLFLAPQLFVFVFGAEWKDAGYFASALSINTYFGFVLGPVSRVFEVYEKQKIALYITVFKVCLVATVFIVAKRFMLSSYVTIFMYAIVMSLLSIINFLYARKFINESIYRIHYEE